MYPHLVPRKYPRSPFCSPKTRAAAADARRFWMILALLMTIAFCLMAKKMQYNAEDDLAREYQINEILVANKQLAFGYLAMEWRAQTLENNLRVVEEQKKKRF